MPIAVGNISDRQFLRTDSTMLCSNFSSVSVAKKDDNRHRRVDVHYQRPASSALEQANLEEVTPGHCIFVLQKHAANGAAMIRQSDFVTLCESARPGKKKDAKVIATALKEFKQYSRFILQMAGCRAAVEGMLRGMTPTWKIQDGKPRVQAAVFVAEQILDEKTGMYFAVETVMVDKVLEELQKGLFEMEENGLNLRVENNAGEDAAEAGEGEESSTKELSADDKILSDALRVTGELVRFLVKRKSRPHLDMKKRARRVYLKKLQISGGPYASTMQLATHISILIGGSDVVQESIIAPWEEAWWTKHKTVDPSVLQMIEAGAAMELEQQKALEAAEAEKEAEGEDVEGDESNGDDVDEEGDGEEGDSQNAAESEEEKKD